MYDNIGGKIKSLAKITFIVEAIASVFGAISLMASDEDYILLGLLLMIIGPVVAWVSSWLLYGYGEIIETNCNMNAKIDYISEKVNKIEQNSSMSYMNDDEKNSYGESIRNSYLAAEKAKREAEERAQRAKQEAEERARRDAQERARLEAEAKAKREAEERAKPEAVAKAKQEAEERAIQEAAEKKEQRERQKEQKISEQASKERLMLEKIAEKEAMKKAELEEEKRAIEEYNAKKQNLEKARHEIEENTKNGIATPVVANRFGEVKCPLCDDIIDCVSKVGIQNCPHCGCLLKVSH